MNPSVMSIFHCRSLLTFFMLVTVQRTGKLTNINLFDFMILGIYHSDFLIYVILEGIGWRKQPNKPTILVEEVNNTDQSLVWEFFLERGETVQNVLLQRKKPGERNPTTFASRLASSSFTFLDNKYREEYDTNPPNTLILRNVTNNKEFIYGIVVTYVKNNVAQTPERDEVEIIVYGE